MSDTLTIGVILLLLISTLCYYLYNRIVKIERKIGFLENILLDLKVATESSMAILPDQQVPFSAQATRDDDADMMAEYIPKLPIAKNEMVDITDTIDFVEAATAARAAVESSAVVNEVTEAVSAPLPTPMPVSGDAVNAADATQHVFVNKTTPDDKHLDIYDNGSVAGKSTSASVYINKVESAYENMTVKELQALAKSKGVSVSGMKRVQMIEALKQADESAGGSSVAADAAAPSPSPQPARLEEIFNSGEGGEPLALDAPTTLLEGAPIDN